jgi:hopanoid biosynthesis associated radical SAM protein HpnH
MRGRDRFPLVLMLEPLFRCNLACPGCGKIQYPGEILKQNLPAADCLAAAEECGAPVVSIAGGEPLLHPEITEIVAGLEKQKRFIYLCTNALVLEKHLDRFKPSKWLTFNIHMDGLEEHHDHAVDRPGTFKIAVAAIKEAKRRGFRVTTNTTVFDGATAESVQQTLDYMTELGVDGCTLSPGYAYEKAPDQENFMKRSRTRDLFAKVLAGRGRWPLSHSTQFLDFLEGKKEYRCTPWGNPCRNVFGWQRPCYLFAEHGYASSFQELMDETDWELYGTGRHPKCANCMAHCGYEASAVMDATQPVAAMRSGFRRVTGRGAPAGDKHWLPDAAMEALARAESGASAPPPDAAEPVEAAP